MADVWCNNSVGSLSAYVAGSSLDKCLDVIGFLCNVGFQECWALVFESWIGP